MEQLLKVFVSYSGNQSKFVASHLRTLLKRTCAAVDPWTSAEDLHLGGPWHYELMKELQSTHFGIICLDRTNLQSPWLHFEAGAVAKTLDMSAVVPYLYDMDAKDLAGPLANFQGVSADRQGTFSLIISVNKLLRDKDLPSQSDHDLAALFEAFWPSFEKALSEAPKVPLDAGTERSDTDVLRELLGIARMHSRLLASVLRATPLYYPPIEPVTHPTEDARNQDMARLRFAQLRHEGMNLRQTGHYNEALEVLCRALALQPDDVETQIDIAVTRTYLDDGRHYLTSIETLKRIVADHSHVQGAEGTSASIVAKAFYNLACIKELARQVNHAAFTIEEILEDLDQALRRYPLYVHTALADQDLEQLRTDDGCKALIERYKMAQR